MPHQVKQGGREALARFAEELRSPKRAVPNDPTNDRRERITPADVYLRQSLRRPELRKLVPLSDTTIYELEQKGEFPERFYLTPRCVAWPLAEVLDWLDNRRELGREGCGSYPDYRLRDGIR